jgi:hypothetical protein
VRPQECARAAVMPRPRYSFLGMTRVAAEMARLRELAAGQAVTAAPAGEAIGTHDGASASVFHQEGDYWTVAYEGSLVRLRDPKGLRYLARLLANPGREVHAIDIEAAESHHRAGKGSRAGRSRPQGGLPRRARQAEHDQGNLGRAGQPRSRQPRPGQASCRHDPDRPVLLLHPRSPAPRPPGSSNGTALRPPLERRFAPSERLLQRPQARCKEDGEHAGPGAHANVPPGQSTAKLPRGHDAAGRHR